MPDARDSRTLRYALVLVVAAAFLAGCGGEEAPDPAAGPREAEWSTPESVPASGSPDGDDPVRSAESLLSDLRARVAEGHGHADAGFQKSVQDVASVLWDAQGDPAALAGAQQHMQILAIAGEVSHWLAQSEGARAERAKSNPTDVAIHDGFLAAAAHGPETYRAWCADAGARLLGDHREARYRKLFPDRVPPKRSDGPEPPAGR